MHTLPERNEQHSSQKRVILMPLLWCTYKWRL